MRLGSRQIRTTLADARRLVAFGKPSLWAVGLVPSTIVIASLLSVAPPVFIGRIVDALQRRDAASAIRDLALYCATSIGGTVVALAGNYLSQIQRERLSRNLRMGLIAKVHRTRFSALETLTLPEIGNRITSDIQAFASNLESSIIPIFTSLCVLAATLAIMMRENIALAFVALALACCAFLPQLLTKNRIVSIQKQRSKAGDDFYGAFLDSGTPAALLVLRNATAARTVMARLQEITQRIFALNLAQGGLGSLVSFGSSLASMIGPSVVLALGAYLVVHGHMTAGTLVTLLIYQSRLGGPIATLSQMQLTVAGLSVTTSRLMDIVSLPDEVSGTARFEPSTISWSQATVRNERHVLLDRVDLTIDRGSHVAVVGPSGAGKTSLALLLLRVLDLSGGRMRIGSTDASDVSLESLRLGVGIVPQQPLILKGSILHNLTLTCPNVDLDAVRRAIDVCHLRELIARFPEGLQTPIGQGGAPISGGESQRICLARGVLQDPSVLVLDEALSGVDVEMERAIMAGLREAFAGRTLIVITHRLHSVADLERIIVMSRGAVVAEGTHRDLQASNAWYGLMTSQLAHAYSGSA